MRKLLIMIFLFCICASIIYAAEPYIKQRVNTPLEIRVPCTLDGGSCSATTSCNLTVIYPPPNSTIFINQSSMTQDNDFFFFNYTNTSQSGDYINLIICCDDSSGSCDKDSFVVRLLGQVEFAVCPDTIAGMMGVYLIFIILFVLIIMAFVFKKGFLGLLSSLGLIFASLIIVGCFAILGYIILLMGVILMFSFAFTKMF